MATATEIVRAIMDYFGLTRTGDKSAYYVGITNDTETRRKQHGNPDDFFSRMAKDEENARMAEKFLLDMGMKGGHGGGNDKSRYVYCFKKY
jgi:hypothetical protein